LEGLGLTNASEIVQRTLELPTDGGRLFRWRSDEVESL
jgi:hypothetical protein